MVFLASLWLHFLPNWNSLKGSEGNSSSLHLEWSKMNSEVRFLRFWGVIRSIKVVSVFVSVIGSAVSEIWRFARFYVFCFIFSLASFCKPNILFDGAAKFSWYGYDIYE